MADSLKSLEFFYIQGQPWLLLVYFVGPYYAGPNSTPAPLTPALITPRQNLGLASLRAAFNATVRKIRKLKNNKEFNHQEQLLLSQHLI